MPRRVRCEDCTRLEYDESYDPESGEERSWLWCGAHVEEFCASDIRSPRECPHYEGADRWPSDAEAAELEAELWALVLGQKADVC